MRVTGFRPLFVNGLFLNTNKGRNPVGKEQIKILKIINRILKMSSLLVKKLDILLIFEKI